MGVAPSKLKIKVGIWAASSLQMVTLGLVSVIPLLIQHFPEAGHTKIQTIYSVPTLVAVPTSLVIGALSVKTGKKLPLLAGIFLMAVCGLIPAVSDPTLPVLTAVMAGIGFGLGCIIPTATGLISDHFDGIERGDVMGKQSAAVNAGGMILAFLGGLFVVNGWHSAYYIFLFPILIFITVLLCVPKDGKVVADTSAPQVKTKLSVEVYILTAMAIIFGICFGVLTTNNALLVVEKNFGEPAVAGYLSSAMSAVGILVGLLYGKMGAVLKKYTLSVGFLLSGAGMFTMGFAPNLPILFLGSMANGAGLSTVMPTSIFRASLSVDSVSATMAVSIVLSAMNLAMFVSPIIMTPLSGVVSAGDAQSRYIMAAVAVSILSLVAFLHVMKRED